jgi:hypothetical protein
MEAGAAASNDCPLRFGRLFKVELVCRRKPYSCETRFSNPNNIPIFSKSTTRTRADRAIGYINQKKERIGLSSPRVEMHGHRQQCKEHMPRPAFLGALGAFQEF